MFGIGLKGLQKHKKIPLQVKHAVSVGVIGGVRVCVVIRDRCRHGHTCRYWASCIDSVMQVTAQVAVVLVVGGGAGRKEGDIDNSVN